MSKVKGDKGMRVEERREGRVIGEGKEEREERLEALILQRKVG